MTDAPDLTTPEARLRWARRRAGFETAEDAAKRFGWKGVTYRSHETGERGFSRHAAEYSKALKVPIAWLLTGVGEADDYVDEEAADVVSLMKHMTMRDRRELLEIARMKAKRRDNAG